MSKAGIFFKKLLAHPKLYGLNLDDPETTNIRKEIILTNSFLRQIYEGWYSIILSTIPDGDGQVLELGSGGGFLYQYLPLITSEIFYCPYVKAVLDGQTLPFATGSLRAIVMIDVLHHIPNPRLFFQEAARCIHSSGVITMIEPWVTPWSNFIYTSFHHEPFNPFAKNWTFPMRGPLSGANGALPWIIFSRDLNTFQHEFPMWRIISIQPMMPFLYLISGGVSMRQIMPGWSFNFWSNVEKLLEFRSHSLAMFAHIVLKRV
jgi:SAM-dependent methyltransferase